MEKPGSQLDSLYPAVVRIEAGDRKGLGYLAAPHHIITCEHVVRGAPSGRLRVQWVFLPDRDGEPSVSSATVVKVDPANDVAVLEVKSPRASPVVSSPDRNLEGHLCRVFGSTQVNPTGEWTTGKIMGRLANGRLQVNSTDESGYWVKPGFSGGPVWDDDLGAVVGIVTGRERDSDVRVARIIPISQLQQVCPDILIRPRRPVWEGLLGAVRQNPLWILIGLAAVIAASALISIASWLTPDQTATPAPAAASTITALPSPTATPQLKPIGLELPFDVKLSDVAAASGHLWLSASGESDGVSGLWHAGIPTDTTAGPMFTQVVTYPVTAMALEPDGTAVWFGLDFNKTGLGDGLQPLGRYELDAPAPTWHPLPTSMEQVVLHVELQATTKRLWASDNAAQIMFAPLAVNGELQWQTVPANADFNHIAALAPNASGGAWVGSTGLFYWNVLPTDTGWGRVPDNILPIGLVIRSLAIAGNDFIWVGHNDGLTILKPEGVKFTPVPCPVAAAVVAVQTVPAAPTRAWVMTSRSAYPVEVDQHGCRAGAALPLDQALLGKGGSDYELALDTSSSHDMFLVLRGTNLARWLLQR